MTENRHPSAVGERVEIEVTEWFSEREGIGPHIRGKKVEETAKAICVDVAPEGRTGEVWIPKSVSRELKGTNSKLTKYKKVENHDI